MTASYTALESNGVALVAHGHPDTVARLIEQGRELNVARICLMSDGGLFFVADVAGVGVAGGGAVLSLEPSPETFATMACFVCEDDAQIHAARHFGGPEWFVRVVRHGEFTWSVDVARETAEGWARP